MELTVVGCSGSFPGPDSAASCYLAEAEGFRILLDLGNGALGPLQRYAGLAEIDAILLSHLHSDHCLDMCGYQVARTYHPAGAMAPIPVYAPDGAAARLDRAAGGDSGRSMAATFDFRVIEPGIFETGPFRIVAARMNHLVETFGFRLEHGGRAIAYSADTGPCPELTGLAADADVLLCEAGFPEVDGLPPNVHLTARQAGEHAARAGAGELVLTHLVPWNDAGLSLEQAAAAFSGPLAPADPGMRR